MHSMRVLHAAVFTYRYTFAILLQLRVTFFLGLALLKATGGIAVRLGHRAMVCDVLPDASIPALPGICGLHRYRQRCADPYC